MQARHTEKNGNEKSEKASLCAEKPYQEPSGKTNEVARLLLL
jgi:hypothetical protein